MSHLVALLLGIVFGFGLILSGMTNPAKVLAFLDISGRWDPSLGLVMAGAIGLAIIPFQFVGKMRKSWLGGDLPPPGPGRPDAGLVFGSALFGIGWGLSGFCPGPALVGLGAGYLPAIAFSIAMVFGMDIHNWLLAAQQRRAAD